MIEAAAAGKLKALYVIGANPVKTFKVAQADKLGGLDLLVVHDMFLTETAQRADVVLPAASSYEKDGTLTNTAGQVQMTHRSIDPQGPRSDFDLIRILVAPARHARAGHADQAAHAPKRHSRKFAQNVPGYDLSVAGLLAGAALQNRRHREKRATRPTMFHSEIFFRPTIFSLRAAPLAVTVPSSNRPKRQKTGRGVRHGNQHCSPGGIASQNRRFAVRGNDGAGVSHLV